MKERGEERKTKKKRRRLGETPEEVAPVGCGEGDNYNTVIRAVSVRE